MSTASSPVPEQQAFAPGLRVEIRDAEWVIKRADLTANGTYAVLVTGISELVRGREARFLTELDQIRPLYPEDTELVADTSPLTAPGVLERSCFARCSKRRCFPVPRPAARPSRNA